MSWCMESAESRAWIVVSITEVCTTMKTKNEAWRSVSRSVVPNSLWPHGLQPARLLCSWNSPGKNTGVGCHFLLQGIFLTQGLNPCLLHCRHILYHLSHQENHGNERNEPKSLNGPIFYPVPKSPAWLSFTPNALLCCREGNGKGAPVF